jgi:molybdopterin-biosynthesis enzyme MoeA-like protein
VIPDVHETIVSTVQVMSQRRLCFHQWRHQSTHDDITADAVAAAFGRTIDVRTRWRSETLVRSARQK